MCFCVDSVVGVGHTCGNLTEGENKCCVKY
ncbi:hypothetical protein barba126A_phanotate104 [Rheinheimera phage vB_RspM_barba_12-6A]|uniref:Uncharacterized protein n=31 Tax=Barbavirus barba18A TaxID=2734090 RepID=A0A7G9VRW4_9CAUD|nr:hypothetical protein barba13A_phanotate51 [Rheinheimera phage vB_RspM_barba_1-3A]QNO01601.1 hypothetical protein barba108A_phanotate90 [Rheinheimera phage vB_RspM_barba_10-8A]QNO01728.1 hypothetical protein barba108B_phanotate57 [Rheinheimera phage vB_RspM_barba_10-8B]QNO01922.1 hypothetical protein barba108D_phanotate91 [Rheinheimera phage vB_RspM_barba_10-8D]QNO02047.1 hypothetical protein barba109A_phanotate55 [Rheinheimera phage vB_RspM_barba_10-9A]QNO02213.1 hypothetical protein barba1